MTEETSEFTFHLLTLTKQFLKLLYLKPGAGSRKTQSLLSLGTKCHQEESRVGNLPRASRVRGAQEKAHFTALGRPQVTLWGGLSARSGGREREMRSHTGILSNRTSLGRAAELVLKEGCG